MKKYFLKKMLVIIVLVLICVIVLKEVAIMIILEYRLDDGTTFLLKGTLKTLLILFSIYQIVKENFFNLKFIFKNIFLSIIISLTFLFFSLNHTFNKLIELKIHTSNYKNFSYLFNCLCTGFFEELFFRILIFGYCSQILYKSDKKTYYREIIVTSLLFGIMHISNFFNPEYTSVSVLNQIMLAISLGIFLQCLFLRFNNIFLNGMFHGLINYNGMKNTILFNYHSDSNNISNFSNFIQTFISMLLISIIFILPISYLLQKNQKNKLIAKVVE